MQMQQNAEYVNTTNGLNNTAGNSMQENMAVCSSHKKPSGSKSSPKLIAPLVIAHANKNSTKMHLTFLLILQAQRQTLCQFVETEQSVDACMPPFYYLSHSMGQIIKSLASVCHSVSMSVNTPTAAILIQFQ